MSRDRLVALAYLSLSWCMAATFGIAFGWPAMFVFGVVAVIAWFGALMKSTKPDNDGSE